MSDAAVVQEKVTDNKEKTTTTKTSIFDSALLNLDKALKYTQLDPEVAMRPAPTAPPLSFKNFLRVILFDLSPIIFLH